MRRACVTSQVYIADGFADDCEELILRCSSVDILTYQTFCKFYKEMKFASVFVGRGSNAEVGELSEELIHIAKHYMVRDTSNFEESVAGLFLVYALLNLQPYPRFAALRVVASDLPALERLRRVARRQARHDVLYVLANVLVRGPVQFHADARPRGMESAIRKNLEGYCNIDASGVRPKGVYSRQNEELDLLRDMSSLFDRYAKAKAETQITGFQRRKDSNGCNLAVELAESLKRVINGITDEPGLGSPEVDRHNTVQEIKGRAMANVVSTLRHLDSAEDRSKSPKKIPKTTTTELPTLPTVNKKRPEKVKSLTKQNNDKSTKKRKSKAILSSADHEEKDEVLTDDSQEEISNQIKTLDFDSLPCLVTTENGGKVYEIEIIDEMKKDTTSLKRQNNKIEKEEVEETYSAPRKSNEFYEIEILDGNASSKPSSSAEYVREFEVQVIDETSVSEDKLDSENKEGLAEDKPKRKGRPQKTDAAIKQPLRVSPRLQQVLKRDLKKPLLKSKFKRMGMLEAANFKDKKYS